MGLLDTDYAAVNAAKPRKSNRILPGEPLNVRGLLDAATNIPVAGDALSGGLAVYDAIKGDYPSAAMNAVGVLPFISAGMIKGTGKVADAVKGKKLTEFEQRHLTAQKNAALPVEQGGLGLPPDNTAMDRAVAMGFDTNMYHVTGGDFSEFIPSSYRGASFFSASPKGASSGASAGAGDMTAVSGNLRTIPVMIKSGDISGMNFNQKEREILARYSGQIDESSVDSATKELGNRPWHHFFSEKELPDGSFVYEAKKPITYDQAKTTGVDIYGQRHGNYSTASDERWASENSKNNGMGGFLQYDEGGLSSGVTNPSIIRSRFAAFDPMRRNEADILGYADPQLLGLMAGGSVAGLTGYGLLNYGQQTK